MALVKRKDVSFITEHRVETLVKDIAVGAAFFGPTAFVHCNGTLDGKVRIALSDRPKHSSFLPHASFGVEELRRFAATLNEMADVLEGQADGDF